MKLHRTGPSSEMLSDGVVSPTQFSNRSGLVRRLVRTPVRAASWHMSKLSGCASGFLPLGAPPCGVLQQPLSFTGHDRSPVAPHPKASACPVAPFAEMGDRAQVALPPADTFDRTCRLKAEETFSHSHRCPGWSWSTLAMPRCHAPHCPCLAQGRKSGMDSSRNRP